MVYNPVGFMCINIFATFTKKKSFESISIILFNYFEYKINFLHKILLKKKLLTHETWFKIN